MFLIRPYAPVLVTATIAQKGVRGSGTERPDGFRAQVYCPRARAHGRVVCVGLETVRATIVKVTE